MSKTARRKQRRRCRSFLDCLRQFLTPETFKQAHQCCRRNRRASRWELQPLLFVLLSLSWCSGDSLAERFEVARGFYVACHGKRRRPGKTVVGFQEAVSRLPMAALRAVATAIRRQLPARLGAAWLTEGWCPLGCDGSRLECPRSAELEQRLGRLGRTDRVAAAPMLWVTALVHLRTGLLWSWRLGLGTASETRHLRGLLGTLPASALLVCDAAYMGYELARAIQSAQASFLFRVSSAVRVYVEEEVLNPGKFREGLVDYWPQDVQRAEQPPLRLRLIRVRSQSRKSEVWLLTNVLDSERLTREQASRFYLWRWENEGLFRSYKRTLKKVKLQSRTVRMVHREAESSLLGVQLLMAQAAWQQQSRGTAASRRASVRRVVLEVRCEIRESRTGCRRRSFADRIALAMREERQRTSSKVKRVWPQRKEHEPPKSPKILKLTDKQKALKQQILDATGTVAP